MKKIIYVLVACMAIGLASCGESPAKRVDKLKAMYDEMYEMAEKDGVTNDAVLDKYQEIENYNMNELGKDFAEWNQEERDYYAKVSTECTNNPMCSEIWAAYTARKTGDPNYGQRPEDSDLDKAMDQAKDAADKAKGAAGNAMEQAKDAADKAKEAAKKL